MRIDDISIYTMRFRKLFRTPIELPFKHKEEALLQREVAATVRQVRALSVSQSGLSYATTF